MNGSNPCLAEPVTWLKASFSTLLLSALIAFGFQGYEIISQNLFSHTHWYQYYSVKPEKAVFKVGESLLFHSDSDINRPTQMEWNDILFCDLNDGFGSRYYSNYRSSLYHSASRPRQKAMWIYGGNIPQVPASCFLHSTISAQLKYASPKVQVMTGPLFNIHSN